MSATLAYRAAAQHPVAPTIQTYGETGAGNRRMVVRCRSCGTHRAIEVAHSEDWGTRATSEAAALYAEGHERCIPEPCGCRYSLNLDLPIHCNRHRNVLSAVNGGAA